MQMVLFRKSKYGRFQKARIHYMDLNILSHTSPALKGSFDTTMQKVRETTDIIWGMNILTNFKVWRNYGKILKKIFKDSRRKNHEG